MSVKSGGTWTGVHATLAATGALTAASVGPVGTLYLNGTANAAVVTVTGANPYKWSVTLPTLVAGDCVALYLASTVADVATGTIVAQDVADPFLSVVPGAYAAGTSGYALGAIGTGAATVTTPIVGTVLAFTIGAAFTATVTGLTISAAWTGFDFSLKHSLDDADSAAVLRVRVSNAAAPTTDGALIVEGVAATAAQRILASLTVTQAAGTVALSLTAALANALYPAAALVWDLKEFTASSQAIRATGTATVAYAVTRAIV